MSATDPFKDLALLMMMPDRPPDTLVLSLATCVRPNDMASAQALYAGGEFERWYLYPGTVKARIQRRMGL